MNKDGKNILSTAMETDPYLSKLYLWTGLQSSRYGSFFNQIVLGPVLVDVSLSL